ncbi:ParB/RepB/Spo0J family partition protein [Candidatus Calescamantes bacterium]|nr:ParB/RepB/Spo0J family partition protein [Candidatus Calescamantes bacterium]
MSRKALGKGLEALIPSQKREGVSELPIDLLSPSAFQSRESFEETAIQELANSIREKGIIEPILVRKKGEKYEIIAGERRFRAAGIAGLKKVPVIIKEVDDEEAIELSLIENLQREDLNPLERAKGYLMLMEKFGLTQEEVAQRVGKSRASVANTLRLLRLPESVKEALRKGEISEGHARVLLSLPEKERERVLKRILLQNLSVRETERLTRRKRKTVKAKITPPYLEELQRILGTRVYLEEKKKGGRLVIEYYSSEDLERILEKLGVEID